MKLPEIVYFQTITECNGHCRYCPFDDVYDGGELPRAMMRFECFSTVLDWLKEWGYAGRISFALQYEPTMDDRLPEWVDYVRQILPGSRVEMATNGIKATPAIFDQVDVVPIGTKGRCTARAGNARACEETTKKHRLMEPPCTLPSNTMCVAASGELLLCCQDWRHEAIVGTYGDMTAAREKQLSLAGKGLEICRDCMAGLTAEEVGERLGKRFI